jgi:hypothetical protein
MKLKDITIKNIKAFVQGNTRMFGAKYNLVDEHIQEQVAYRAMICKESCLPFGKCEVCGCSVPGKLYVTKSCNKGDKFPDLMSKEEWEKFKKENNI